MPGKAGLQIPRPFFKWIRTLLEDLFVHRAFLSSNIVIDRWTGCRAPERHSAHFDKPPPQGGTPGAL